MNVRRNNSAGDDDDVTHNFQPQRSGRQQQQLSRRRHSATSWINSDDISSSEATDDYCSSSHHRQQRRRDYGVVDNLLTPLTSSTSSSESNSTVVASSPSDCISSISPREESNNNTSSSGLLRYTHGSTKLISEKSVADDAAARRPTERRVSRRSRQDDNEILLHGSINSACSVDSNAATVSPGCSSSKSPVLVSPYRPQRSTRSDSSGTDLKRRNVSEKGRISDNPESEGLSRLRDSSRKNVHGLIPKLKRLSDTDDSTSSSSSVTISQLETVFGWSPKCMQRKKKQQQQQQQQQQQGEGQERRSSAPNLTTSSTADLHSTSSAATSPLNSPPKMNYRKKHQPLHRCPTMNDSISSVMKPSSYSSHSLSRSLQSIHEDEGDSSSNNKRKVPTRRLSLPPSFRLSRPEHGNTRTSSLKFIDDDGNITARSSFGNLALLLDTGEEEEDEDEKERVGEEEKEKGNWVAHGVDFKPNIEVYVYSYE